MNAGKFAVKFRNSTKVVYIENHADIYESIHKIYQGNLPRSFSVKYDDKELGIVDLDSPIQLADRKSNIYTYILRRKLVNFKMLLQKVQNTI